MTFFGVLAARSWTAGAGNNESNSHLLLVTPVSVTPSCALRHVLSTLCLPATRNHYRCRAAHIAHTITSIRITGASVAQQNDEPSDTERRANLSHDLDYVGVRCMFKN
jgi:hypothetical protein